MNEFISIFSESDPTNVSTSVKLVLLLTVLSLAPSILILMTCFTRIVIVLSFTRTALATQQMPPNQVIIGLALFLTFFIMAPTFSDVNEQALQPLFDEEIGIGLKAGIGRADNMEDAAYMADIGLEIIRAGNNKDWIHVIEEL